MAKTQEPFVKTPFKKQASVISSILNTNPILNDDEKASMRETVGILIWLNQLQIHWAEGGKDIPADIHRHIFVDRKPQKIAPQTPA